MALIFKKSVIENDFAKIHKLIFSLPKVGKTTLAAEMKSGSKEPLFAMSEDGDSALEIYSTRITNWDGLVKFITYLESNSKEVQDNHSCLVFDLIQEFDDMCTRHILNKYKIKDLGDLPFGKGWTEQKTTFQDLIKRALVVLPCVFIAHSVDKKITINKVDTETQVPNMSKNCYAFVNGKVDVIGWIIPAIGEAKHPRLTFKPSGLAMAGSRFKHMCEKDFELNINDMKGSYKAIAEYFKGK